MNANRADPTTPFEPDGSALELRQRAQAALLQRGPAVEKAAQPMSPEAMQQALHDLEVHQIELEMQNEELHRTQSQLTVSRELYADLYDRAPVGYCTLNEQGLILQANLTLCDLLGVAHATLVRQVISKFIARADQDIYYLTRNRLIQSGEPQSCELRLLKADGAEV